jgi:hypothetical protein
MEKASPVKTPIFSTQRRRGRRRGAEKKEGKIVFLRVVTHVYIVSITCLGLPVIRVLAFCDKDLIPINNKT